MQTPKKSNFLKLFISDFLLNSGLRDEFIFIKNSIPKDINFFFFLILLIISFNCLFVFITIGYFYFVVYIFIFLYNFFLVKKNYIESKIIFYKNSLKKETNSIVFFIKKIFIEYPKSKSFLVLYNIIYYFKNKNSLNVNTKNTIKYKIMFYVFKRLFYYMTQIPFVVLKINCILYNELKNILKYEMTTIKSLFDNIFLNLYLNFIVDSLINSENYKIIILINGIELNPNEKLFFFRGLRRYFENGVSSLESISTYRVLENKDALSGRYYKHFAKVYMFFDDSYVKHTGKNPLIIFNETKSSKLIDKNNQKIDNRLEDSGSKNEGLVTYKAGPICVDQEKVKLIEVSARMLEDIQKIKSKHSWFLVVDAFYQDNLLNLDNSILVKNSNLTLEKYFNQNYSNLNVNTKKFIKERNIFILENKDLILNMNEEELIEQLIIDYNLYSEQNENYFFKKRNFKELLDLIEEDK